MNPAVTIFWLATAVMSVTAALFVLIPLWRAMRRPSPQVSQRDINIALFRERGAELEQELASGQIERDQFDSLMLELQQSLLSDVADDGKQDDEADNDANDPQAGRGARYARHRHGKGSLPALGSWLAPSRWKPASVRTLLPPLLAVVLMSAAAYRLYSEWGYMEDVRFADLFQRTVNKEEGSPETQTLILALGAAVRQDMDRPWVWYFLGRNFADLGMFQEAEIAYWQSSVRLQDDREKAMVLGQMALARYFIAEFVMTPDVMEAIEQARELNPAETTALQLLASDAEDRRDWPEAIGYWRLLIQNDPNSEPAARLRQRIAEAQQLLADDTGPVIEVEVSLADDVRLDPAWWVFVTARDAEREAMPPLAVTRLRVGDLPATVRLDDTLAVGGFNLSSVPRVYVSALITASGTANAAAGDYRAVSEGFDHDGGRQVVELIISEQLP